MNDIDIPRAARFQPFRVTKSGKRYRVRLVKTEPCSSDFANEFRLFFQSRPAAFSVMVPIDAGLVFCRDAGRLVETMVRQSVHDMPDLGKGKKS